MEANEPVTRKLNGNKKSGAGAQGSSKGPRTETLEEERVGGDGGDQTLQSRRVMLLRTAARRHAAAATWKLLMCFQVLSYLLVSSMGEFTAFSSSSTEWLLWPQALGVSFAAEKRTTLLQLWLSSSSEFSIVALLYRSMQKGFLVVTG